MKTAVSNGVMRLSDENTIKGGIDSKELMLRAGKGIFASYDKWGKTCVVCGVGNNGGDGFVIATQIKSSGGECRIVLLEERFSPDGRYFFEKCRQMGIEYEVFSERTDFSDFDTVADCIFGTGFCGVVSGNAKKCIEKINESGAFVISADINLGISGDSGLGEVAVISDLTVAVQFYKTGHFIGRAKDVMKEKRCVDIGISLHGEKISVAEKGDFKDILKKRPNNCHKGNFGYTAIIGGCMQYSGAVKLSDLALSALRGGCGVTKLCIPSSCAPFVAPHLIESTLFLMPDNDGAMIFDKERIDDLIKRTKAVCCGMGWGNGGDNGKILSYIIKN
jgi:NAD(P)H-hydrate epimerase